MKVPHRILLLALCHMFLSAKKYVTQGTRSIILKKNAPRAIQSMNKNRATVIMQKILEHMDIAVRNLPGILEIAKELGCDSRSRKLSLRIPEYMRSYSIE